MATLKLGRRALSALPVVIRPTIIFDSELKGFGLRLTPHGSKSWIVEYRPGAGGRSVAKKRITLGPTATLSPERAREMARTMLASVRLGGDPGMDRKEARTAKTISELEPLYSAETNPLRKLRTIELYHGLWANHLLPALGGSTASGVTSGDVARLHRAIGRSHPSTANRVAIVLAHFFEWAQRSHFVLKGHNPARGIKKFKEERRERYLTTDELARLGAALRQAETEGVPWLPVDPNKPSAKHSPKRQEYRMTRIDNQAAAAIRLLIFTGARLREVLHLQWSEVDLERGLVFLTDSKSGKKTIVLGTPAIIILDELKVAAVREAKVVRENAQAPLSPYVFSSSGNIERPKADLKRPWTLILRAAELQGLRLHDLRHSFASVGAGANMGLPIIGKLLGHADTKTTSRYAHLDADPLRRASDLIGTSIAAAMGESRWLKKEASDPRPSPIIT